MLPIVEGSNSPPSDEASVRSNQSNGAGFFRSYQGVSGGVNGVLTPDLIYAEIGHGRGVVVPQAQHRQPRFIPEPTPERHQPGNEPSISSAHPPISSPLTATMRTPTAGTQPPLTVEARPAQTGQPIDRDTDWHRTPHHPQR